MKLLKILSITVVLAATGLTVSAQDEHMRFKRVEIKGTEPEFLSLLKSEGFTEDETNGLQLKGTFAGYPVTVQTDKTCMTCTVYQVKANLENRTRWNDVESDYMTFKENLTAKYGDPQSQKEEFEHPYRKGDGYELKAMAVGKVQYHSFWLLQQGVITIQIVGNEKKLNLQIRYADNKGLELQTNEEVQMFLNDL